MRMTPIVLMHLLPFGSTRVATSFVDVKMITNGDWLTRWMTIEVIADIDMCLSIVVFFLFRLVWDAFLCICIVKRLNISFVIRTTYCKYNHATKLVCLVRWRRRRMTDFMFTKSLQWIFYSKIFMFIGKCSERINSEEIKLLLIFCSNEFTWSNRTCVYPLIINGKDDLANSLHWHTSQELHMNYVISYSFEIFKSSVVLPRYVWQQRFDYREKTPSLSRLSKIDTMLSRKSIHSCIEHDQRFTDEPKEISNFFSCFFFLLFYFIHWSDLNCSRCSVEE